MMANIQAGIAGSSSDGAFPAPPGTAAASPLPIVAASPQRQGTAAVVEPGSSSSAGPVAPIAVELSELASLASLQAMVGSRKPDRVHVLPLIQEYLREVNPESGLLRKTLGKKLTWAEIGGQLNAFMTPLMQSKVIINVAGLKHWLNTHQTLWQ